MVSFESSYALVIIVALCKRVLQLSYYCCLFVEIHN